MISKTKPTLWVLSLCFGLSVICYVALGIARGRRAAETHRLPTGRTIAPMGQQDDVGSFPANMALSPDGRWLAVTDTGFRQYLSIVDAQSGQRVWQLAFNGRTNGLYYGLAWAPTLQQDGSRLLYASCGALDRIAVLSVDAYGVVHDTGRSLEDPSSLPKEAGNARPNFEAGIALSSDGSKLYVAHNESSLYTDFKGSVSVLDTQTGKRLGEVTTAGFPYAIVAITAGPNADKRLYVSSEMAGVVSDIDVSDPEHPKVQREIATGDHPIALLLNPSQNRLIVANASSDSISLVDTGTDRVLQTLSLRGKNGLPGITPTGLALDPQGTRLYVSLGDLDAVAVIHLQRDHMALAGMVPAGWYPTAVCVANGRLFVANAKGSGVPVPNGEPEGPNGEWGHYIENILEGTVQVMPVPDERQLAAFTRQVEVLDSERNQQPLPHTGIKHVIYIIKENRTYDQVLGDLPEGNGDPKLCIFGRAVTPNQHALAERFVLLDNFYCAGEVSPDGWNWSTAGMANEYVERNVPYNYSGRGRDYDFEGEVNGVPVGRMGLPDVAAPPNGYLWDAAQRAHITYRNYGFFVSFDNSHTPDGKPILSINQPVEPALVNHTDVNFMRFDTNYADSDAYRIYNCPAPTQLLAFGANKAPDRIAEWKREFERYVKNGDLPALEMVRIMRDHTAGTRPGVATPAAMVADNDYAVGQIVEAVSHSHYWKSTAIFIVEDDAQNGYDHVDCHRSTAYVISPYIQAHSVDHHFYNTDSILHTIEELLGLKPMCLYDAMAPVIRDFTAQPNNSAPYTAILPAKTIIAQINRRTAYGARASERMDFSHADCAPPNELNSIIWRSVKGAKAPLPPVRHSLAIAFRRDDDDD